MKQGLLINDEFKIGNEILAYLIDHPNARDTLDGIIEWWLLKQHIKFQTTRVQQAVSELVAEGLLIETKGSDSQIHYRINPSRLEEIKKLFNMMSG